ncbi:MAG: serine/threonine-protein kinase [Nannocystaceae bacterium]
MTERLDDQARLDRIAHRLGATDSDGDAWVRDRMREELFGTPAPVRRVGRYVVERRIGRGGMGEVFVGRDEGLERRVALKMIKGPSDDRRRARFLREGRALAKLSHPNTVQVYEVGEHEDQLFIAMELVRGQTLAAWAQPDRSVDAITRAYLDAARGLAAAHAAGIVHRDFKPDNAMMGDDGRVRVLDFGLARRLDHDEGRTDPLPPTPGDTSGTLTSAGAWLGTPAYMAPEQHRGLPATVASDQFSLCVSLYEALQGSRPFEGADCRALLDAIERGALRPLRRSVPRRVRSVLRRGLAAAPEERFPTMDALIEALRPRVRPLRIAGFALAVGIVGGVGLRATPTPCAAFEAEAEGTIPGLWDDDARAEIRRSLHALGQPHVDAAWEVAEARLGAWTAQLGRARRDACQSHQEREEDSAVLYDLRMACLQGHHDRLQVLLDELRGDPSPQWERIEQLGGALPSARECADARSLHRRAAVRPGGPQVERIDGALSRAHAQLALGRYGDALATVETVTPMADQLGSRPVQSDVAALRGRLEVLRGEHQLGLARLQRAAHDAQRDARDQTAARRWATLANLSATVVSDSTRGRRWLEDAEVSYERADMLEEPSVVDRLDEIRALFDRLDGRGELAEHTLRRRLDRWRTATDPAALLEREGVLVDLASVLLDRGEDETATALLDEALAIDRSIRGDHHPRTAQVQHNLGLAALERGELAPAAGYLEQALATWSTPSEDRPADVARVHRALAAIRLAEHDLEAARTHATTARTLLARALPPDHLDLAEAYNAEGVVCFAAGDLEGSIRAYRAAVSIYEGVHGAEHVAVAMPLSNLGESLVGLGRFSEAEPLFDRALVLLTTQRGDDAADLAYPLKGRGLARLGRGRIEPAQADLRRAWAVTDGLDPDEQAEIALGLSMALRTHEPAQADDFARRARSLASDPLGTMRMDRLSRILSSGP